MSGTRLPFPMARAIECDAGGHTALIVAHGSPSEPEAQERELQALATRVNFFLPGWKVRGTTLAAEGRFEEKVVSLGTPLVFPFFMAQGYFTEKILRGKTSLLGFPQLEPFGTCGELVSIAASTIREIIAGKGWHPGDTQVLIAAHGSKVSNTSSDSAYRFSAQLKVEAGLLDCICGFVEEAPFLDTAACNLEKTICLPFFAIQAGHVVEDVPNALSQSGFQGPVLAPFIKWPQTPGLIARALQSMQAQKNLAIGKPHEK